MTKTESVVSEMNLLWVDDQVSDFGSHIAGLKEEGFTVTAVAGAAEALSTLRNRTFDVILIDLKLKDDDGIDLLRDMAPWLREPARTKIIVLSSFLYESVIRNRLIDLNLNVALLEKAGSRDRTMHRSLGERILEILNRSDPVPPTSAQFSSWDHQAEASDPFAISYERYLDSPLVVRRQLDEDALAATTEARNLLRSKGVVWALFCGSADEPVQTADDETEIPSEEHILDLASGRGHPPYEFYGQGEFEELESTSSSASSSANTSGCVGAPDFPFFKIRVVHYYDDDISINRSRDFHFDSGLDVTAFAMETALEIGLEVDTSRPAKFIEYREYDGQHPFYPASGSAVVERGDRGTLDVSLVGRAYLDWAAAPFSRHCLEFDCTSGVLCHRRHALLGRNLLVENGLHLDVQKVGP